MKKAVFVLGTYEYEAARNNYALTAETQQFLSDLSDLAGLNAAVVFAVSDPWQAGKSKTKISMKRIREERERTIDEISAHKPDLVVMFGPVAAASILDRGDMTENHLMRAEHRPFGDDGVPAYYTFGIENLRANPGLRKWMELDVMAAESGNVGTTFGEYTVIRPDTPEWNRVPAIGELRYRTGMHFPPHEIGFDLETYPGLDPWHKCARIRMAVLSTRVGDAYVVLTDFAGNLPQWVVDILEDPNIIKCGSNIKYDVKWCRRFGITVRNVWDTSTVEHILDGSNPRTGLKFLTLRYVPKLGDYARGMTEKLAQLNNDWSLLSDDDMVQYAGADGEASIGAYLGQKARALETGQDPRPINLMLAFYPMLCELEHNGACVDLAENTRLGDRYLAKLTDLRNQITLALGPINPNSPQQLAEALQREIPGIDLVPPQELKRALGDEESDEASTARIVLERESAKHPVLKTILEFRKYRVRNSTFIEQLRSKYVTTHLDGLSYIHPSFNTAVTETYRLSSSQPNGQNIPRKDNDDPDISVKRQFVSRFAGGGIIEADQSQLEIRYAAWLSNDQAMREAIDTGQDIHTAMASIMLGKPVETVTKAERQACKSRTFLILYGGGAKKLARDLKIAEGEARRMIDEYFTTFSGLKLFIDDVHETVKRDLRVTTAFGFTRRWSAPHGWNKPEGWAIQRQAFNTHVQSGAACMEYCANIALHRKWGGLKSKRVLVVHDSTVVDYHPNELEEVKRLLKWSKEIGSVEVAGEIAGIDFATPLRCDLSAGKSWGSTQEVHE